MAIEFEVFSYTPDFTDPVEHHYVAAVETLRVTTAPPLVTWPHARTERASTYQFSFDNARDIRDAKDFLARKGGQHEPFLLPTWERDLSPSTAPNFGTRLIEVAVADYSTTYLAQTRLDTVGRYLYCFDVTQGFHAMRVLAATPGATLGTSLVEVEQALPWTPLPLALWGWLRLVRQTDDNLEFRHASPTEAAVSLAVKTIRQWADVSENSTLASGVATYATLPFITASVQAINAPKTRNDYSHATGPLNLHFNQSEAYAVRWCAWLGTASVRIGKFVDGVLTPPSDSLGLASSLFPFGRPENCNHLSLAFDQNSWEVIAYQKTAATVGIRRRFNGALVEHTFIGQTPQVAFNGIANFQAVVDGVSDVVCYYLRPGQNLIFARAQRDNFGIEYVACHAPTKPLTFINATDAGRKDTLIFQDAHFRIVTMSTGNYPLPPVVPPSPFVAGAVDDRAATALLASFAYAVGVVVASPGADTASPGLLASLSYGSDTVPADPAGDTARPGLVASILAEFISGPPPIIAETASPGLLASIAHVLSVVAVPSINESAPVALAGILDYTVAIASPQPAIQETATNDIRASIIYAP